jgi:hypothetical protein
MNGKLILEYVKYRKPNRNEQIPIERLKWVDVQSMTEFNEVLISVCKETLTEYNIQFIDNMTQIDYFVNLLNRSNIIPYKIKWQKLILWDE